MNSSGSLFTSDQYAYDKQLCCRNCQGNYTNNKFQMVNFENMYIHKVQVEMPKHDDRADNFLC